MKIKNIKLDIKKLDIFKLSVEGIVCPVDNNISLGPFLSSIVKKERIQEHLRPGASAYLKARGIKAKYVILPAIYDAYGKTDEMKMRVSCHTALKIADRLKLKSIAFPPLGEKAGFPPVGAAKIMTQEVLKYLRENETRLQKIIFCLYDNKTYKLFDKTVRSYVEHILYKFSEGPFVTVDAIIELKKGVILIERSNPPYGLALPGGFVDYGESLEEAVAREAKEETNMRLTNLRQFHTYSKPDRDPRFHTIGTVFIAQATGIPRFGDDAQGLKVIPYKDLLKYNYAFDHKNIIKDYLISRAKR